MNDRVNIRANTKSIGRRKMVHGAGLNDSICKISQKINGKKAICQYYRKWADMLNRCYNPKFQERDPTYIGVTVCEEWLTFSRFKSWMETQDWEGMELDKDIIKPGNKMYSPETCCFVPRALNGLLNDRGSARGDCPRGVTFYQSKYIARCGFNGKNKYLGLFSTPEEASLVYRKFKANLVAEIAFEQVDERIEHGLMLHAGLILKGE